MCQFCMSGSQRLTGGCHSVNHRASVNCQRESNTRCPAIINSDDARPQHRRQQEEVMYDLKNLNKMKHLETYAPEAMRAFVAFDQAALAEGAIPRNSWHSRSPSRRNALIASSSTRIKRESSARRIRKSLKPCWSPQRCARVRQSPTAHM